MKYNLAKVGSVAFVLFFLVSIDKKIVANCVHYWVNPATGRRECLDNISKPQNNNIRNNSNAGRYNNYSSPEYGNIRGGSLRRIVREFRKIPTPVITPSRVQRSIGFRGKMLQSSSSFQEWSWKDRNNSSMYVKANFYRSSPGDRFQLTSISGVDEDGTLIGHSK